MKVPELEEQQGRNIYLSRSEYLSTTMLPWTTPSHKRKVAPFVRTNDNPLISVWANDHILGRRSWSGLNLDIPIIQYTRSIEIKGNNFITQPCLHQVEGESVHKINILSHFSFQTHKQPSHGPRATSVSPARRPSMDSRASEVD